jgi:hypothetical protein
MVCVGWCAAVLSSACGPKSRAAPAASEAAHEVPQLRDGFEGDALAAFWRPGDYGSGRFAPGAVVLSDERARSGLRSAQITVREGDVAQLGDSGRANERAELDSGKWPLLDREVWCGFSFFVPADFPIVEARLVLAQWKQSGLEGSPIVAQRFQGGRHYVTIRDLTTRGSWRKTIELPPIAPERWTDMVYHLRFASDPSGLVEIWLDGERVASVPGETASPEGEGSFYHKLGLYRDKMAEPMTIFVDNYALGASFASVDPARFDG